PAHPGGAGPVGDVPGLDGVLHDLLPIAVGGSPATAGEDAVVVALLAHRVVDVSHLELVGERSGGLELGVEANGAAGIADVDERHHRLLIAVVVTAARDA